MPSARHRERERLVFGEDYRVKFSTPQLHQLPRHFSSTPNLTRAAGCGGLRPVTCTRSTAPLCDVGRELRQHWRRRRCGGRRRGSRLTCHRIRGALPVISSWTQPSAWWRRVVRKPVERKNIPGLDAHAAVKVVADGGSFARTPRNKTTADSHVVAACPAVGRRAAAEQQPGLIAHQRFSAGSTRAHPAAHECEGKRDTADQHGAPF